MSIAESTIFASDLALGRIELTRIAAGPLLSADTTVIWVVFSFKQSASSIASMCCKLAPVAPETAFVGWLERDLVPSLLAEQLYPHFCELLR